MKNTSKSKSFLLGSLVLLLGPAGCCRIGSCFSNYVME